MGEHMRHYVVVLGWVIGLAGCSQSQKAHEPDLKALAPKLNQIEMIQLTEQSQSEPVTIQEAAEQLARATVEPNEPRPTVELTLQEIRTAALANNLDLKVELLDPAIAQQSVDVERAKFESVFFGSAQYSEDKPATGNPFAARAYEVGVATPLPTGTSITASVPLWDDDSGVSDAAVSVSVVQSLLRDAGTRVNTQSIRIATYEKGIVDAGTKLTAINILANIDISYWLLYAARKELDVRREQYKLAQDQLRHARNKVQAGSAPKYEIVLAEAGLYGRLEDVITAETTVRDRERDLKRIMNRKDMPLNSDTAIIPLTDPDPKGLDLDAETLAATALENRMDLIMLELRLAVNELDVELAKNATLPRLDLDYTYTAAGEAGSTGRAFRNIADDPAESHAVALSATIPLGNRAAEARLRRARLQRIRTQADRQRAEQLVRQEVYETVDGLQQNWRRILAAEQGTVRAYRDYQVEQQQFQLGARRSTDVLLATSRLADAQLRRIRAFAEYEIAQIQVARATGTLLGHGNVQLQPVPAEAD
ncbi:MAG: TolC family protein [Sedimentisphaerales bacterium]|nr:TolC family protein [Sedimentisphaerales bacterium]